MDASYAENVHAGLFMVGAGLVSVVLLVATVLFFPKRAA